MPSTSVKYSICAFMSAVQIAMWCKPSTLFMAAPPSRTLKQACRRGAKGQELAPTSDRAGALPTLGAELALGDVGRELERVGQAAAVTRDETALARALR